MISHDIRFGPFTLLPAQQRLLRDGEEVPLGPRAVQMLCVLAARPGELVSKDELLDTVWQGHAGDGGGERSGRRFRRRRAPRPRCVPCAPCVPKAGR